MFDAASVPLRSCMGPPDRPTPGSGENEDVVDQRTRIERAKGSSRTIAIVPRCDGSPQEENVESAPRQAPRNPQARCPAGQRVPGLPSAQAAASDVPDLQDVPRTRSRATAYAGPLVPLQAIHAGLVARDHTAPERTLLLTKVS